MKSEKYLENSKRFYFIEILFILCGLILSDIEFNDFKLFNNRNWNNIIGSRIKSNHIS